MDFVNCGTPDAVSRQTLPALVLILLCLWAFPSLAEESHPGLQAESTYAEAVLAYNRKDYSAAKVLVEGLIKSDPKHVDSLQLLALIYRSQGKPEMAYGAYRALVQLKPESERGPYYFELASILYGKKQFAQARPLFQRAIWRKFNITPSHLFMGLIDFNDNRFASALDHFEVVAADRDPDMSAIGHYYVGTILLKSGAGGLGLGEILEARAAADRAPPESASTKSLGEAASKIVAPFDKGQWFASATLIPQFDSNVSLFPISSPGATGLWTIRTNYTAGGGYVTSPMRLFQFVASARAFGNLNFVPGTEVYNFHNFSPAFYVTYKPMGRISVGMKAEGTITFQYGTTDGVTYANRPFAFIADSGLFLRWQPTPRFQLQWDAGFRPQLYVSSPDFTGWATYTRVSSRITSQFSAVNPGFGISAEFNYAAGDTWRYAAPSVELNNLFRIGSRDNLIVGATLTGYRYSWWSRLDGNLVMRASNVFTVSKYFTWLLDLSYTVNTSTEAPYSYNRWTAGTGVGFAL